MVLVGVTVSTVVSLGLAPVLLTVGEAVRRRRAPAPGRVAGLLVALVGLVLVSAAGGLGDVGPHPGWGILAAVASGSMYAFATALGRPLAQRVNPLALTTAATTVGALGLLPLGLVASRQGALWSTDPVVLVTLAYLGVLTMALAYALLYAGLRTTTGSAAVVATLLEPVTAAVVAAVVLDERLGPAGVVGTVLILAAVVALGRGPRSPASPAG